MDEYIKQSIDARRNAFASYKIDAGMQKKIDALFGEIEKLGAKCKDAGEFETKFATSSLNQKYIELFTEVTIGVPADAKAAGDAAKAVAEGMTAAKTTKAPKGAVGKMVAEGVVEGVAERALEEAEKAVLPTRAAVNQEIHDAASKVPVLGDAMDISQKAGYAAHLGKLFGKRKKK